MFHEARKVCGVLCKEVGFSLSRETLVRSNEQVDSYSDVVLKLFRICLFFHPWLAKHANFVLFFSWILRGHRYVFLAAEVWEKLLAKNGFSSLLHLLRLEVASFFVSQTSHHSRLGRSQAISTPALDDFICAKLGVRHAL